MPDHNPKWVERHKEEIEREAFRIYQMRQQLGQEDSSKENWESAIRIVWLRYQIKEHKEV